MDVLKVKLNDEWISIPAIKGEKGDAFTYSDFTPQQLAGLKGEKGDPFTVKKTFPSISDMNSYTGTDVVEGDFVVISSNVEDPDNGKLYIKAAVGYTFITDLSGAQGMKGDRGSPTDVQINGTSIVVNDIADIPLANSNAFGVVKIGAGLSVYDSKLVTAGATSTDIKGGGNGNKPVVPSKQHEATFYGLAKAAGDTTQAQSSNSVGTYTPEAKSAIRTMLDVPASGDIPTVPVTDVQVNGTSILSQGVANIPIAGTSELGVTKYNNDYGISVVMSGAGAGTMRTYAAAAAQVKGGTNAFRPITPEKQHESTFFGLAKVAGADMASISETTVGVYPAAQQTAIKNMLGVTDDEVIISDQEPTSDTNKLWIEDGETVEYQVPTYAEHQALAAQVASKVDDVQVNGTSVVSNGIANVPVCSSSTFGVVKVDANSFGIKINDAGRLYIDAPNLNEMKAGTQSYKPIVPSTQHTSVFYGLAKASGDTSQASSSNAVGNYTADAKSSIQNMLDVVGQNAISNGLTKSYDAETGRLLYVTADVQDVQVNGTSILSSGVANIPVATQNDLGVVKVKDNNGIRFDSDNQTLKIRPAYSSEIKDGTNSEKPITTYYQQYAVFYGLSKAAGVNLQSATVTFGEYPPESKAAIQSMLGVETGVSLVETVSGSTPSITGQPNVKYKCGEVSSISVTPPANGSIEIMFTSGTTPAVLTLPNTVKFPVWFDATALETNTVYDIIITDATYGAVMTWAS